MAFDQHIEADQVGDDGIGLFSSIIARPILWLLGGDQDKAAEEKRKEERKQLERDVLEASDVSEDDAVNYGNGVYNEHCEGSTCAPTNRDGDMDIIDEGRGGGDPNNSNRGNDKGEDNQNDSNQMSPRMLKSWPQVGVMGTSTSIKKSQPPRADDCSHSTQIVDDLVAVMESSTIDPKPKGPATSAMASRCELSSSAHSLSASHSASAFPNQEISPQHKLQKAHSSNSIKSKKTSWSDERGSRPLVEYSDDFPETVESTHWTQLRRKKRRSSFDNGDEMRSGTRSSQVRVIKSALRSGSYSPPVTKMYARGDRILPSHSTSSSSSSSSNQAASGGQLRSFHSLSMIGSSTGSSSTDSMSLSGNSHDFLAEATREKLSIFDNVQCVPSTLQQGAGRANGGLIIPRGGPSAAYHLTMGTRACGQPQEQVAAKENQAEDGANVSTSNNNYIVNGRMQAKAPSPHHHMFLPHPPNGYVSPQYGFYVNITPPTPLHAAATKRGSPLRPFEESSPQQQSFHGFSPALPSPIPEVELAKEKVGAPTLGPLSKSVEAPTVKNRLKPTFPKNRVGMGMVLAGNHYHQAWPSIPMG
jgi:hypothetical protein